ncbi:MAG: hypothetical protein LBG83_07665 [Oscillospiraceae bacterium]|jgi:beta-galactosidase|nr:hypothetical protein [Oscillospiraceae bacterium]
MTYRIQRSNHRSFEMYEQNKRAPRAYFIPYKEKETLRGTPDARQRYESDWVRVLSGAWDFCYFPQGDIPKELDPAELRFDEVQVPHTWQRAGYEAPVYLNTRYEFENIPPELPEVVPAGVYRKRFALEEPEGKTVIVAFLGACSCVDVYCNGYHIGYSEGSHNTAEFELSNVVREGLNELLVVVHKWSTGTFLECQDMFRENGIFRDVLLYELPGTFLNDFWIRPVKTAEGEYRIIGTAEVLGETNGWSLDFFVEGLEGAAYTAPARERLNFSLENLRPTEWNAEQPALYTAWLTLRRANEPEQVVKLRLGFKDAAISGSVFTFNGQAIKFKGVNHHDTDPAKGYCMSYEDYERDLKLMKEFNVNAIRTSHYPPDPHLLMLADELGFYVVDEADIETHGAEVTHKEINLISNDKKWIPRYLDRVKRMLFRDRAHACVTMWSLGNEAGGWHCQDACYAFLHAVQPEIPVHYEGACRTPVHGYDVHSEMYTDILRCQQIGQGKAEEWYQNKPFFLCEYAHAMGFGPGNLEEYWQTFYQYENLMGGCIWEWADHAVDQEAVAKRQELLPPESRGLRWTYGGDHGERIHDSNFCVDGLFYPDRRPHTGAYEMKNVYRPLRAARSGDDSFVFRNTNRFAAEECQMEWTLLRNGQGLVRGFAGLNVPAMGSQELKLLLPSMEPGAEYHITFCYGEKAFEQIALQECAIAEQVVPGAGDISPVIETARLTMQRAWLDNDLWAWTRWYDGAKPEHFDMRLACDPLPGGAYQITGQLALKDDDDIPDLIQISRFGLHFVLPREWDQVRYCGLGERENLPDCRAQALFGVFEADVAEMNEPYLRPQENGTHCEVRWLELTDKEGRGLRIANPSRRLCFSAHTYSPELLAAAKHQEDLHDEGRVFLTVEGYTRGTGSSSCGPETLDEYKIDLICPLEFSFVIYPVGKGG